MPIRITFKNNQKLFVLIKVIAGNSRELKYKLPELGKMFSDLKTFSIFEDFLHLIWKLNLNGDGWLEFFSSGWAWKFQLN